LTFSTPNISGGTFSWTGVNSFGSSSQNPTISNATIVATGTYTATVTVNGCTSPSSTLATSIKQLPNAPISNPSVIVYDGVSHNGLFQLGTGEDIFWYAAPTGASTSVLPTQTTVGKKEAYAEAKLNAAPFCISATRSLVSVEITPAPLTVKNITGANKPYDGNTVATVNGTPTYDGLVAADAGFTTVQGGPSFNFDTKDAGTNKPITVTGYIAPSTNYTLTQPTGLTANITPAPLTIAGISGANKVYDRNTTSSVTGTPIYIGLVAGENLNVVGTPTYSFANKNAGIAKPITVLGFTAPNGNYTLSAQPTGITADITPKLLTVTGTVPVRVYDATTNTPGLTLDNDRISGDIVNVSRTSAAFVNPNAGVNKDILLSGVSIIPGNDGENYFLASPNVTIQGTITPLPININANDTVKTELDPDPVFTFTHSPALYTPEVFTGTLSRIPGETPADYPLTIGSLSAGNNYTLNLNSARLTIKPLVTNYIFEVPNAFTPNLDGTNDLLNIIKNYRVTGLNYFRIYNRTGQLVFETNNLAQGWNGRRMGDMSGNVLESDLYIWVAEFTRMNDSGGGVSIERKTGSVLLLK
jgi:gliding motility-associated-like protein